MSKPPLVWYLFIVVFIVFIAIVWYDDRPTEENWVSCMIRGMDDLPESMYPIVEKRCEKYRPEIGESYRIRRTDSEETAGDRLLREFAPTTEKIDAG